MFKLVKQFYENILKFNYKYLFLVILSLWFIINLIQALTTGVIQDEAYYHFYSEKLAWGYFDHPPIVALMIKMSSFLFSNGLDIRFMTILLQIFTLVLIWKTVDGKENSNRDVLVFFGISASVVMFVVYGFITTPDSPLLFFTALLLFSYKKFLKEESFFNCALLTISMAGLIYSKYQGGLVILFVILSNPRLLINYKFWLSGIAALFLFAPHVIWQFENDFAPFKYHLGGRSRPFKISMFLEYLPNQAANFNPFILVIIGYILYKFRSKDLFFKSLKYIIIGMILFFWGTTFRGHAEPQWTIAASIPIIIMIFYYSKQSLKVDKYLKKIVYPSLFIIFLLRVVIACDAIPLKLEFYNQDKWANHIKKIAGDRVVVFRDGYQKPSLYKYYAKGEATTINSVYYRQNQYDLYGFNNKFYNRKVMVITDKNDTLAKAFKILKNDSIYVRFSDKLILTSNLEVSYNEIMKELKVGSENSLNDVIIINKGINKLDFNDYEYPISLHLMLFNKKNKYSIDVQIVDSIETIDKGESIKTNLKFFIPNSIESGEYRLMFSFKCGPFREGYNSRSQKITIQTPLN